MTMAVIGDGQASTAERARHKGVCWDVFLGRDKGDEMGEKDQPGEAKEEGVMV